MLNLEIKYDSVENIIYIKNNAINFTGLLWFSITDCETNLNVTHWWMNIAPYEIQTWNLPESYYQNVKEFTVNVMDHLYNILFKENIKLKKINKKFNFKPKNLIDITYGSWESLIYRNEYDIQIKKDDIVYDLGANVGTFSMWCLMKNVKYVYAFEPDPICISNMHELFIDRDKIQIVNKAISNENKKMNFYLQEHSISNSLFIESNNFIQVECIDLENFINLNNFKKPTIIKCDIEGAEYDFVKNLSEPFFDSIRIFILEFHLLKEQSKISLHEIIEKFLKMRYSVKLTDMSDFKNNVGTLIFEK